MCTVLYPFNTRLGKTDRYCNMAYKKYRHNTTAQYQINHQQLQQIFAKHSFWQQKFYKTRSLYSIKAHKFFSSPGPIDLHLCHESDPLTLNMIEVVIWLCTASSKSRPRNFWSFFWHSDAYWMTQSHSKEKPTKTNKSTYSPLLWRQVKHNKDQNKNHSVKTSYGIWGLEWITGWARLTFFWVIKFYSIQRCP